MTRNVAFILALVLFGCNAPRYLVDTKVDDFDGYTRNRLYGNWVESTGDGDLRFNLQQFKQKGGETSYSIVIHMSLMHNWFFIEDGESLIMLVEGQRIGFSGEGSINHRDTGRLLNFVYVEEMAFYDVSLEKLYEIANAKDVRLKVRGANRVKEGSFTSDNFSNLRQFLNQYVKH